MQFKDKVIKRYRSAISSSLFIVNALTFLVLLPSLPSLTTQLKQINIVRATIDFVKRSNNHAGREGLIFLYRYWGYTDK